MKRCVIVGAAEIKNYEYIRESLGPEDYMIYCDGGLRHQKGLDRKPDLIVGDFDSSENPHLPVETIVLPCEKDDTDTGYAVKEALKRGFSAMLFVGVFGGRLDHSLGNLSLLLALATQKVKAVALDDTSEIEIVSETPVLIPDRYRYFSLLALDTKASGVTIENAKYPLHNGELTPYFPLGISNEVCKGKTASVFVKSGRLILIKVRNER